MATKVLEPVDETGLPIVDPDLGRKKHLEGKIDWRDISEIAYWMYGRGMAPETEAHMKLMATWGKMNVWDAEDFRKVVDMPFAGKSIRWIASIPAAVMSLMLEANPTLLADREEFLKWLKDPSDRGGARFRVPGARP